MSSHRLMHHSWGRATGASLGVGGYLIVQALLAGAPIGESLLGGTIVAVALFLYYAILYYATAQRESFPSAVLNTDTSSVLPGPEAPCGARPAHDPRGGAAGRHPRRRSRAAT